ncbi:unnamed protein product [Caenorhabditis bovis]|uniref:Uncharacterized protein n=1 Tax=Caenorhabditis bovis TaxID=2654633 RepID=A0A8S1F7F4_9PELO|nr:unnamed protein product [Caenorhabditis bovis]
MPPKKAVAKKPVSKTKNNAAKKKPSKLNKAKTKQAKRKTATKQKQQKRRQKQRKDAKRATKAKRKAAKARKKATKKKTKNTKKNKKKSKEDKKKKEKESKKEPQDDSDEGPGGGRFKINFLFSGLSLGEMQNVRLAIKGMTKEEFIEHLKNFMEQKSDQDRYEKELMGTPEDRMALFTDQEKPTDPSAGPFQSNRFGAIFLLPGQ